MPSPSRAYLAVIALTAVLAAGPIGCQGLFADLEDIDEPSGETNDNDGPNDGEGLTADDITTLSAEDVGLQSATLRGRLEDTTLFGDIDLGFCWHTDEPAEQGQCTSVDSGIDGADEFSHHVDDLSVDTDYVFRAFAEENVSDPERVYADHEAFTTDPVSAPQDVVASENIEEHVLVEWEPVELATGYEIRRDGIVIRVINDGSADHHEDDTAEPGPEPDAPEVTGIEVDDESIHLFWEEPDVSPGPEYTYTVTAIYPDEQTAESDADTGYRAPSPVDTYEIRRDTGDGWSEWDIVSDPNGPEHLDDDVPLGTISIDENSVTAGQGTHPDFVELRAAEAETESPDDVFYELRAINETGPGDSVQTSTPIDVAEDIDYTWEASHDGGETFDPIDGCSGLRDCDDDNAPADGSDVHYQLRMSADGTASVLIDELVGYRAVLDVQFIDDPPDVITADDQIDLFVEVIDQDGEPIETIGFDVELSPEKNDGFGAGEEPIVETTDGGSAVEFSALSLRTAVDDEQLTVSIDDDEHQGDDVTNPFDVIAGAPSSDNSAIYVDQPAVADGEDKAVILVELFDSYENPIADANVDFEVDPSDDTDAFPGCNTEGYPPGVYECSMSSTNEQERELLLLSPIELHGGTISFLPTCEPGAGPFGGGDGSPDNPYLICDLLHLDAVGEQDLGASFELRKDLLLAGSFDPIGSPDSPFYGHFNGNEYPIEGLAISDVYGESAGMFGAVATDAVIENVVLSDVQVVAGSRVGALVGQNGMNADEPGGDIINCHVDGTVSGGDQDGEGYVGGLVGRMIGGSIVDSSFDGHVLSGGDDLGGLVGYAYSADITNSRAEGFIEITGQETEHIGGLVGEADGTGVISDSHTEVQISSDSDGDPDEITGEIIGGLVGTQNEDAEIIRSYATGDFITGVRAVGGLVGWNAGLIEQSYSATETIRASYSTTGGLVGFNTGQIADSYATVNVHGTMVGADPIDGVGGLVGLNISADPGVPEITNSYSTGSVNADGLVGGLVGSDDSSSLDAFDDGVTEDSFWDVETSGHDTSAGGEGLISAQFEDQSNFPWDFDDIWEIGVPPGPDSEWQRPVLQWQD